MSDLLDPADSGRGDRTLESVSVIDRENTSTPAESATPPSLVAPVLRCRRVSKWYGPVIGVNQVSLELRPGITGLVGSNGAGKTTLMRLITGQLKPDLGEVEVLGLDPWTAAGKRTVGYCPDADTFYEEMTGRQFLETMARLCGYSHRQTQRRINEVLDLVGMSDRSDRSVQGFSKGMRQRIKLAQALLHDPTLLVLDEPLSGIDPIGRAEFLALFQRLADLGKCLLISSHELDELEKLTDHVIIMARGRIAVVGTVAQIRDRLDQHPLTVRLVFSESETSHSLEPRTEREIVASLWRLDDVVGMDIEEDADLAEGQTSVLVRARQPQRFFRDLTKLIVEEHYDVRRMETLDDSTQAVLSYLLGGK